MNKNIKLTEEKKLHIAEINSLYISVTNFLLMNDITKDLRKASAKAHYYKYRTNNISPFYISLLKRYRQFKEKEIDCKK